MIGVFLDVPNLYGCIHKAFGDKKLSFKKYMERASEFGSIHCAIAYGYKGGDESTPFINNLQSMGFKTKFTIQKDYSWRNIAVMDIVRNIERIDSIILGSSNPVFLEVMKYARERGSRVIVHACGIPKEMRMNSDSFQEVTQHFLMEG